MERDRRARKAAEAWVPDGRGGGWPRRLSKLIGVLAGLTVALPLAGCLTAYTREAPGGVYPEGPLSGPPSYYVGWTQPFTSPVERRGKDFTQSPLVRPDALSH